MADRYLLESSATDGYQLEDGSGVLLLEQQAGGDDTFQWRAVFPDRTLRKAALSVALVTSIGLAGPVTIPQARADVFTSGGPTFTRTTIYQSQAFVQVVAAAAEDVTLDKWLGDPPKLVARRTAPPATYAAPVYTPEIGTEWWRVDQPLTRRRPNPPSSYVAPVYTPEIGSEQWRVEQPGPLPQRLRPSSELVGPLVQPAPAEEVTLDKWLSESPLTRKRAPYPPAAFVIDPVALTLASEDVTIDKWLTESPLTRSRTPHPPASFVIDPVALTLPTPEPEDVGLPGAGSWIGWRKRLLKEDEHRSKRWLQRRRQIERISDLIDGVKEEIPADVPEAQVARKAEAAVEKAADKLLEDVPMPAFDWRGLSDEVRKAEAALKQAEKAFQHYKARVQLEMDEQDDEDVLLLMA